MKINAILVMLCLALINFSVQAKEPGDADIRKLLEVTGSAQSGAQLLQMSLAGLRQRMPDAPQSFWDEMAKDINPDEIIKRLIPIYKKHLTDSDVKGVIKFYESDIGVNLKKALPHIQQESMMVGQQWGREVAEKVVSKYQKEYADKQNKK